MANVPLTIINSSIVNDFSVVYIGNNAVPDSGTSSGTYWYIVVDRTNLNVVANYQSADPINIPSVLTPYQNNSQYMLILVGNNVNADVVPTSNLYAFLQETGSGVSLQKFEQVVTATGSGFFNRYGYLLVAVMDGSASFDYLISGKPAAGKLYTLQLVPVDNGNGGVLYTPQKLNGAED